MVSYSDLDLRNSRIYVTNYNLRRGSLVIGFVVTVLAVAGTYSLIQSSIDALKNSLQLHFTRLDLHFVKIEFEERKSNLAAGL